VIGEMDAVATPGHAFADPSTGAAHTCGHNVQTALMLGVALVLSRSGAMAGLVGDAVFLACPAEEFVEMEYRKALRNAGRIEFFGGKQELIRTGAFDDVDLAMMVHAASSNPDPSIFVHSGSLGFVAKMIRFEGREAHAVSPEAGVNALNAAMAALMLIHAQRETFREADKVRIHPIVTKGGDMVNVIPADVAMETYVRARSDAAIAEAAAKVDRAVEGACHAIGAKPHIETFPGYLPLAQDRALGELFLENFQAAQPRCRVVKDTEMAGSTDMGDLTAILPAIQPLVGGFEGAGHGPGFHLSDPAAGLIAPVKAMAAAVIDLLADGAETARGIRRAFRPQHTKESYLKHLRGETKP
jgi:amidohydrolase